MLIVIYSRKMVVKDKSQTFLIEKTKFQAPNPK